MQRVAPVLIALLAVAAVHPAAAVGYDPITGDLMLILSPLPGSKVAGETTVSGGAMQGYFPTGGGGGGGAPPCLSPFTESSPNARDLMALGAAPGADVGSVWIDNDTCSAVSVNLRVFGVQGTSAPSVDPGAITEYAVEFEHEPTGVVYTLRAYGDLAFGWQFSMTTNDVGGSWICTLPAPLTGSGFADGVVTWNVQYADINLVSAPPTAATGCGPFPVGPPAAAGDNLTAIEGMSNHQLGIVNFGPTVGDVTTFVDNFTLGPKGFGGGGGGGPIIPVGPFGPVKVTVNGLDAGTTTTDAGGLWSLDIDFDEFPVDGDQRYKVRAYIGTVSDSVHYNSYQTKPWSGGSDEVPQPADPRQPAAPPEPEDTDGDGIDDSLDTCGRDAEADQVDTDGDGRGDACDTDLDGDAIPNVQDNCLDVFNPAQTDVDRNGVGDACDLDTDGDGIPDLLDICVHVADPSQADLDRDGAGDACDADVDGDGTPNAQDPDPRDRRQALAVKAPVPPVEPEPADPDGAPASVKERGIALPLAIVAGVVLVAALLLVVLRRRSG